MVTRLGSWAIRFLLVTLAVSSLARLVRQPLLLRLRRLAGLWAFSYAMLHVTAYLALLAGFRLATVASDVVDRPYITVGLLALLCLVPLAATSTRGWQRRLGPRWRSLHRLVYPAAIAAWTHLLWLSKGDLLDPLIYGGALALLLLERLLARMRRRRARGRRGQ